VLPCGAGIGHARCARHSPARLLPCLLLPLAAAACYICCRRLLCEHLLHLLPPLALRTPGPRTLGIGGHPREGLSNQTLAGLGSDHILTTQTTRNQNMAGTKVRTFKLSKCTLLPDLASVSGETGYSYLGTVFCYFVLRSDKIFNQKPKHG